MSEYVRLPGVGLTLQDYREFVAELKSITLDSNMSEEEKAELRLALFLDVFKLAQAHEFVSHASPFCVRGRLKTGIDFKLTASYFPDRGTYLLSLEWACGVDAFAAALDRIPEEGAIVLVQMEPHALFGLLNQLLELAGEPQLRF